MYVGNIFSSDLFEWDTISDHHNLVRGYILENHYILTHPYSKLAQMQTYKGLKGAEYEARDMPLFQEKYLNQPSYNDYRHFILSYELARRFFLKNDQANIQNIRNLAITIQKHDRNFKSMRDAVHGRIAASLLPMLSRYRDNLPKSKTKERIQITNLMTSVENLTSLDESVLSPQIKALSDRSLRDLFSNFLHHKSNDPIQKINSLTELMVLARHIVAGRESSPSDSRKLTTINVIAAAIIQSIGRQFMDAGGPQTVGESLTLLKSLANATYGTGLISERERKAISNDFDNLMTGKSWGHQEFVSTLKHLQRVIEWSHAGAVLAFGEVWPSWTYLVPDIKKITDDIVRSSPMLLYGMVFSQLDNYVSGKEQISHQFFDKEFTKGVRALNSGLSFGDLAVVNVDAQYSAWKELQRQAGKDGSDDSGREAVHAFTQKMGYKDLRSFQGWMKKETGSRLHGNELHALGVAEFLFDTYHNHYPGAKILWKIMHATRTGRKKINKYTPKNIYIAGKTGTYYGPTESKATIKHSTIKARNHITVLDIGEKYYSTYSA